MSEDWAVDVKKYAPNADDKAIAAVGEKLKSDRSKNRVAVYYLLAEQFGKLSSFSS